MLPHPTTRPVYSPPRTPLSLNGYTSFCRLLPPIIHLSNGSAGQPPCRKPLDNWKIQCPFLLFIHPSILPSVLPSVYPSTFPSRPFLLFPSRPLPSFLPSFTLISIDLMKVLYWQDFVMDGPFAIDCMTTIGLSQKKILELMTRPSDNRWHGFRRHPIHV